ncbi:MAG: NADPH:quinone reductase [Elusimicrobiota bacterium]
MKAIIVRAFGGPEVLRLEEAPDPRPGPGEVLVSVKAVGVNPVEAYLRSGSYPRRPDLPFTPGTDAAGLVSAVGSGVAVLKPGQRVYVYGAKAGVYAQKAVAEVSRVFPLPDTLSFEQGAAVGVPFGTAHRALFHHGKAKKGQTVLIHGASGGVGTAAVQLARAAGLTVIGTAGGPEGVAFVKALGADQALDHRTAGYLSGLAPDLIVEMLANVNLPEDLRVCALRGRIVIVGSRGEVTIDPRAAMTKDITIQGMTLWNMPDEDRALVHADLGRGFESGALAPVIGRSFPLAEAAKAHEAVMSPGARGKIVLIP